MKTIDERIKFIKNTPDTTVDVVLVTQIDNKLHFLLTRRENTPDNVFPNQLGLCGVYFDIQKDKTINDAVVRGIKQKINLFSTHQETHSLKNLNMEFLGTFSNEERDPRWHTLTVVMVCYFDYHSISERELENDDVVLLSEDDLDKTKLAFDHNHILNWALKKIKKDAQISAKIIKFLPEHFTLPELQTLYEAVLDAKLDKSSFRKQVRESNLLIETGNKVQMGGQGKPAILYRVNPNFDINNDWFFPRSVAKNK